MGCDWFLPLPRFERVISGARDAEDIETQTDIPYNNKVIPVLHSVGKEGKEAHDKRSILNIGVAR